MDNAPVSLSCPSCGALNEFQPVTVIRPDTEELVATLRSQLNFVVCTDCATRFRYETPLLYRDDPRRLLIYYLPGAAGDDPEAATAQFTALFEQTFGDFADDERPTCRLVTRYSHLIEKIALAQAGYDDRLVEYIKYMLLSHSPGLKDKDFDLLYDFSSDTGCERPIETDAGEDPPRPDALRFLAFDRTGKPVYSLDFARADYDGIQAQFTTNAGKDDPLAALFPTYRVHVGELLD